MGTQGILEWIKAASTVVAAIGVALTYYQVRRNVQWNKLNAALTYLNAVPFAERERAVAQAMRKYELNYHDEDCSISNHVQQILADPEVYSEVKYFLNFLELNAAAIRIGALDADFAYHHRGDYYLRNFELFNPLVEIVRKRVANRKYWSETEALCKDWEKRKERENRVLLIQRSYP